MYFRDKPGDANICNMSSPLPPGYRPAAAEAFMSPPQVEYFRQKLLRLRAETQRELDATPVAGPDDSLREGDQADQASAAVEREYGIHNRERAQALLAQVGQALTRLDNATYGYCEDTGEPIGLGRLDAQPTATLSIEAQARRERQGH